jgi:hypothetical protein
MYIRMYHTYIHTFINFYKCMYIYIFIYIYIHTHTHLCACVCLCVCVCVCVRVCVCIAARGPGSGGSRRSAKIRGSESSEAHAVSVWEEVTLIF